MSDTAKIPSYIERYPECPLCLRDCGHDGDSICCEECGVYWRHSESPGIRYMEYDEPACGAETQPWAGMTGRMEILAPHRFRCVLDADHDGDHRGVRVDHPHRDDVHSWKRTTATAETAGEVL